MSKEKIYHVGIDVSAKQLAVAVHKNESEPLKCGEFDNTVSGHKKLLKFIGKGRPSEIKICMEATGIYHFNLALFLSEQDKVLVMVVNPLAMKHFATAMLQRGKTDRVDAISIMEYVKRMRFVRWSAPSDKNREIQAVTHRLGQLTNERAREKTRLTNNSYRSRSWEIIEKNITENIAHLTSSIKALENMLSELIDKNDECKQQKKLLESITGVASTSASLIISEIINMPHDLTAPQLVAFAGLDPKPKESGSSINKPRRISKAGNKRLRGALFMPAMSAIQHQPNVKSFYEKLISKGKTKMQAIVAVMRKLLNCIYGMLKTNTAWDGEKFYKLAKNT